MEFSIQNKIKILTDQLHQANHEYYNLNNTILTDHQYDALLKELILLEKEYPQYKLPYSPTFKVGGGLSVKFNKMKHDVPMLSLDNVFNFQELKDFNKRLRKKVTNFSFITELKIDGVAISLKYKKGILEQALTRGNGDFGELITENVKTIKSIPLKLSHEIDLEVRGEILFDHNSFQKLNYMQQKKGKTLFSNPRNAASGTLRHLNSQIVAQRNLFSFFYLIVNPPNYITTQEESLIFLKKMNFSVNSYYEVIDSFDKLKTKIDYYYHLKKELPYDTDGVVIKINELESHSIIGYTTKFPKWAIAYKFSSIKNTTVIINISFQVGRTGMVTPLAHLSPIIIGGSLVSKATLHNYDYIKIKDIRVNDTVLVHKTGSIIPEIIEVVKEKRTNDSKSFEMIQNCPFCNSELKRNKHEVDYFCLNEKCSEKTIKKIIHFTSKEAMDINFLGKKNLILLFQKGFIKKISDLYDLQQKIDELENLFNFGKKKIDNILKSLEKSKFQTFDRFLFGLGIRHVGIKIAKLLTYKFKNINNLKKATYEEISIIPEIGTKIAESVYQYFKNENNLKEIELLEQKKVISDLQKKDFNILNNSLFQNKKISITGSFRFYSRKKIIMILEQCGAHVINNVSSNTDYLICGHNSGSKLNKAKNLKIKILNEQKFENILSSLISVD
ncbi:NAD-dependent DNA ligase LigA [Candidatus Phytoplasma pini]|uniref:DNA ligase n=1 Tax=Candidatus Phytoplasma pini TaxID=267362 RepID=A0A559KK02_9MOLU|nr:NAD-dependent DNA ligase LigA [Candidatus Phytoplasma pini]TVY12464.1 NAD-dependent DNA ligase [Candidatus Phytoplasma pini]